MCKSKLNASILKLKDADLLDKSVYKQTFMHDHSWSYQLNQSCG